MAQKQNSRPLFDQRPQHPRRPRIGLLGREKRLRKFSRMRERASGMLCLKNEFPDSFECLSLIGHKKYAQSEAIINRTAFLSFLYEGVYLQTRLFSIPVLLVQESFPREEFFGKMGPTKPTISNNLAC